MEERAGLHGAWMGAHNVGGAWIPRTTLGMEAIQVREQSGQPIPMDRDEQCFYAIY